MQLMIASVWTIVQLGNASWVMTKATRKVLDSWSARTVSLVAGDMTRRRRGAGRMVAKIAFFGQRRALVVRHDIHRLAAIWQDTLASAIRVRVLQWWTTVPPQKDTWSDVHPKRFGNLPLRRPTVSMGCEAHSQDNTAGGKERRNDNSGVAVELSL